MNNHEYLIILKDLIQVYKSNKEMLASHLADGNTVVNLNDIFKATKLAQHTLQNYLDFLVSINLLKKYRTNEYKYDYTFNLHSYEYYNKDLKMWVEIELFKTDKLL